MKIHILFKTAMTALCWLSFSGTAMSFYGHDPEHLFTDDELNRTYGTIYFFDTLLYRNISISSLIDSGTGSNDGSPFIKFNYQFVNGTTAIDPKLDSALHDWMRNSPSDTARLLKEFDFLYVYRPGFAGFTMTWDYAQLGYLLSWYKYLILTHQGPLPNHKVTILGGWSAYPTIDAVTGASRGYDTIGTFGSSDSWKAETLHIPPELRTMADSVKNIRRYVSLSFLINNLTSKDTMSSPPGCLSLDNIFLAGIDSAHTITEKTTPPEKKGGCGAGWGLAILPPLFFRTLAPGRRKKRG